jgi:hypothetical protein
VIDACRDVSFEVSPRDPLAQSLGYSESASSVDRSRFPTYKQGQTCSTCRFYQGSLGAQYGPCQIFSNKTVSSIGWCVSFGRRN